MGNTSAGVTIGIARTRCREQVTCLSCGRRFMQLRPAVVGVFALARTARRRVLRP